MNNTAIPMADIMKDLGVGFQSNLKFDKHVSNITSSANSRLGIINIHFRK